MFGKRPLAKTLFLRQVARTFGYHEPSTGHDENEQVSPSLDSFVPASSGVRKPVLLRVFTANKTRSFERDNSEGSKLNDGEMA